MRTSRFVPIFIVALMVLSLPSFLVDEGSDASSSGTSENPLTVFEYDASAVKNGGLYYHVALGSHLEISNNTVGSTSYKVKGISTGFGIVMNDTEAYGILSKTGEFHVIIETVTGTSSATTDCILAIHDTGTIQSFGNDQVSEAVVGKQFSNMYLFNVDRVGNNIDEIFTVSSNGVKCGNSRYTGSSSYHGLSAIFSVSLVNDEIRGILIVSGTPTETGDIYASGTSAYEFITSRGVESSTTTISSVKITVKDAPIAVTGITLDKSEADVKLGSALTLQPVVAPSNADDKSIVWTSSNSSVAAVDSNGVVTGLSIGQSVITATTVDGSFTASCNIRVIPNSIIVSGTPDQYGIVGTSWSFSPTVNVEGCSVTVSGASWLHANGTTVSGTPSQAGSYNVTLTFSKTGYNSVTKSFAVTVLSALEFTSNPSGGAIIYAV